MCEFPEHYTRNWFGDLWIYSFIWIPILVILILWLKKNLRVVKEKILLHKIKVVISSIVTVVIIIFFILIIPIIQASLEIRETYREAVSLMENKNYLSAINEFEEVIDYNDSQTKINEIHSNLFNISFTMIEEENYSKSLEQYLQILQTNPEYEKEAIEFHEIMREDQEKERAKLREITPYEGMSESDVYHSSWGPPSEVNKDVNYDSLLEDSKVKHLKWIIKDHSGRIVEIRTLMIKQGVVWGEPKISHY